MKSPIDAHPHLGRCVKAVARSSLLVALLLGVAVPGITAQASAQFDVMISVRSAERAPRTGVCDSGVATDPTVSTTVICGFAPAPDLGIDTASRPPAATESALPGFGRTIDAPPRRPATESVDFVPGRDILANAPSRSRTIYEGSGFRYISYITGPAGSVDIFTAAGTSTAFRLVNWADREYIEMTVGW